LIIGQEFEWLKTTKLAQPQENTQDGNAGDRDREPGLNLVRWLNSQSDYLALFVARPRIETIAQPITQQVKC